MIGLDTNVIIRYIAQDDVKQSKKATQFIEGHCTAKNPGYLNLIVIAEIFWVLETAYKLAPHPIIETFESLLRCPQIEIESHAAVSAALREYKERKIDFSDALIGEINKVRRCQKTVSFDKVASKSSTFISL